MKIVDAVFMFCHCALSPSFEEISCISINSVGIVIIL